MSEENKNVQETKDDKKEGNVLAGFVLYTDANMDWLRFKKFLKDDWNIVPQDDVKDNAMVFKVGDMVVACSLMPNPVPNKEAENAAKYNILWKEGANEVAKHQAHVMLAVMNKTALLSRLSSLQRWQALCSSSITLSVSIKTRQFMRRISM